MMYIDIMNECGTTSHTSKWYIIYYMNFGMIWDRIYYVLGKMHFSAYICTNVQATLGHKLVKSKRIYKKK